MKTKHICEKYYECQAFFDYIKYDKIVTEAYKKTFCFTDPQGWKKCERYKKLVEKKKVSSKEVPVNPAELKFNF